MGRWSRYAATRPCRTHMLLKFSATWFCDADPVVLTCSTRCIEVFLRSNSLGICNRVLLPGWCKVACRWRDVLKRAT
ncbi:hypothetical protein Y032_0091g2443 [Ancylostoma ceylanicum]|uniref:Uncharacterized protein n=1 Tax=Ancylostoma ceylanicum TaxID=53326 RepID=A0A016TLE4_9BILA|nr:hypothetical protein Y032_0091g2443 [Ancylostoma ceylanicum]